MPLDPRVRLLLRFSGLRPNELTEPPSVRRFRAAAISMRGARHVMRSTPDPARTLDWLVPVEGGRIRVRILVPPGPGPHPLYVFIHGGGWVNGTVEEREPRCRAVCAKARCVVASIEYRLAPENQFPTAPEDCWAALCHLVERADELGVDPDRIAVGGESAGGNLAAALCLMSRDRNGPPIVHQWLDVPALDCTKVQEGHRNVPDGYLLDAALIDDFLDLYFANDEDRVHPYASPLLATDLSGLPPAWIMTAEYDKLRGDGLAYAERLAEAGVAVHHERLAGHVHPSFAFTRIVPSAAAYEDRAIAALRAALHPVR